MLVREDDDRYTVSVPAMTGCFSMGSTREDAIANVQRAMELWLEEECSKGRGPLPQTKEVLVQAYAAILDDLESLRAAGDVHQSFTPEIDVVPIEVSEAVPA